MIVPEFDVDYQKTDSSYQHMDMTEPRSENFRVAIHLIEGFPLMAYASVVEPLRAANILSGRSICEVRHFGETGDAVRSSGSVVVPVDGAIGGTPEADLILVIAGGDPFAVDISRMKGWYRKLASIGCVLGGVSGGPVLLARAGVMRGRRMTVHWEHAQALSETVPDLILERSLYVMDRDRVTCGGGTAPVDLMHALLSGRFGSEFARSVSDWFLHTDIRPSAGPQRAGPIEPIGASSRPVLDAVALMESHIADPLTLEQLARLSGVSGRQLNRLFHSHAGRTAMEHYRRMRLETAARLLGHSTLSLTEIAFATGFSGSSHFSAAFRRAHDLTPGQFRRRGRGLQVSARGN